MRIIRCPFCGSSTNVRDTEYSSASHTVLKCLDCNAIFDIEDQYDDDEW